MDRRLAAGELQHAGAAFEVDEAVHHSAAGVEVEVGPARPGLGEAHRTLEIALRSDLDEGDACVLLMFRAEAAVVGTALIRLGSEDARQAGGLAKFMAVVVSDVRADEVVHAPVLRTLLAEVDPLAADDDLGIDKAAAGRAKAPGGPEKDVVAQV